MNTKKILHFMLLINLILCFFVTMSLQQPLMAVSVDYDFGFEGTTAGVPIVAGEPVGSDNIFSSAKSGVEDTNFATSSSVCRSGTRSFKIYQTTASTCWFNATYSKASYLTNFTVYSCANAEKIEFQFKNMTTGHEIVVLKYNDEGARTYQYEDETGTDQTISLYITHGIYYCLGFQIVNELGDVDYFINGSTEINGVARNPSYIVDGERIDQISFVHTTGTSSIYFDDMNWTLSSDYNGTGGGSTEEGCIDTTDFLEFQNGLETQSHSSMLIDKPIIEFTTYYPVSLTPEVFELMVTFYPVGVIYPIGELSDYFLYINGLNLGNPICMYPYLSNEYHVVYALQWDISSMGEINNTVLDFELVSLYADGGQYYWELYTSWVEDPMANPFDVIWAQDDSQYLDGVVPDGHGELLSQLQGACWRIFYSEWNPNPTPEPYNNSLNFIFEPNGFKQDTKYNGNVYIYSLETGMVEFTVDKVDGYYSINFTTVYGGKKTDIYSYHDYDSVVITTDDFYGDCWVNLTHTNNNTVIISKKFWLANLSEKPNYNPDFYVSVMTEPNPSNVNSPYSVIVYNNNISRYDYWYLCRFKDDSSSYAFSYAIDTLSVTSVNEDNITSFNVYTKDTTGYEIWILFASNDNNLYLNLFEHKHYIRSVFSDAYLYTDLTDDKGYTDTPFNIIYFHSYTLSRVDVKFDGSSIRQNTDANQRTSFSYSSGSIGYHDITLELQGSNGTWTILKTVKIQLAQKTNGGGGYPIFPPVDQPLGSIIGMIVTIFCLLSPFMLIMATHSNMSIHPVIYAFTGGLGLAISTVIGWFPVWLPLFVVVCGIIVLVIFYVKGQTSSGE